MSTSCAHRSANAGATVFEVATGKSLLPVDDAKYELAAILGLMEPNEQTKLRGLLRGEALLASLSTSVSLMILLIVLSNLYSGKHPF